MRGGYEWFVFTNTFFGFQAGGLNNGEAGDVYLRVDFAPHTYFDVDGLNLILTVPISPWEAALGAKIVIPTLTSKLNLTIPAK